MLYIPAENAEMWSTRSSFSLQLLFPMDTFNISKHVLIAYEGPEIPAKVDWRRKKENGHE